ncbi:hypothetical protein [Synechococcus sp. PROS-U-1]|uniref:hypothetical protein n=1 Tax=Synechococcus sp. PROS-U-1 TaxID=1400866 RepID=UPI0016481B88|nr:hypothetical protein [Synechococcus sp. PROS-U-1]
MTLRRESLGAIPADTLHQLDTDALLRISTDAAQRMAQVRIDQSIAYLKGMEQMVTDFEDEAIHRGRLPEGAYEVFEHANLLISRAWLVIREQLQQLQYS